MSTLKKISLFVIIAAVVVAFMSPDAMARRGRGGENNLVECPANVQYMPPHFSGKISVFWDTGNVYITGLVKQGRKCTGHISPAEPFMLANDVTLEEFQGLTINDIKGFCVQNLIEIEDYFPLSCQLDGFFKIINAYGLRRTSDTSFTVNVVMMNVRFIVE